MTEPKKFMGRTSTSEDLKQYKFMFYTNYIGLKILYNFFNILNKKIKDENIVDKVLDISGLDDHLSDIKQIEIFIIFNLYKKMLNDTNIEIARNDTVHGEIPIPRLPTETTETTETIATRIRPSSARRPSDAGIGRLKRPTTAGRR